MYLSVQIIYLLMEEKLWGLRNKRTYNTNMFGQYFLTWKFFREFLGAWNLLTNMADKKYGCTFLKYTYLKKIICILCHLGVKLYLPKLN